MVLVKETQALVVEEGSLEMIKIDSKSIFSKKLADGTNKGAKILALIYGVKLCKRLEFSKSPLKLIMSL